MCGPAPRSGFIQLLECNSFRFQVPSGERPEKKRDQRSDESVEPELQDDPGMIRGSAETTWFAHKVRPGLRVCQTKFVPGFNSMTAQIAGRNFGW